VQWEFINLLQADGNERKSEMTRILVIIPLVFILMGCSKFRTVVKERTDSVTFEALVVSKEDKGLSVVVLAEDTSFKRFEPVHVNYDTASLQVHMGDIVEISFHGSIAESYPCQIGADDIRIKEQVTDNWPATGSIPDDYTVEEAVRDHCFVMAFDIVEAKDLLDAFISNTQAGMVNFLRKVSYTKEGDPIITDIIYDGIKYYVFEDYSRDKYAGGEESDIKIYKNYYNYINTYIKNNYKLIYLAEKSNITAKEYENSIYSGNSKDYIKTYPLYHEIIKK
jgi:hypothetical protein